MKNSRSISPYLLAGLGIGTVAWFALKPGNTKIQDLYSTVKNKFFPPPQPSTVEKAGHPDPHDIDDNTMVSEGAMYGVNYYNEKEQ